MTTDEGMAARFETDRSRLRTVAVRMLGSWVEADDALQEAWLRVSRPDTVAGSWRRSTSPPTATRLPGSS